MQLAGWIPLRAALAWVVTRDDDFVKWVLPIPAFDAPMVLASGIRDEMHEAGCFVDKPIASKIWGEPPPVQEELAKNRSGRFQELAQAFEDERLKRPGGELCPREYLLSRIEMASKDICRRIGHRELQARGVAVDGDAVGRARDILPSEITETMVISRDFSQVGWLLQEPCEHSSRPIPALKSMTVLGDELVRCFPADGTDHYAGLPAKPRRGRSKGDGSYAQIDEPLLEKMDKLIESHKAASPEAAARLVAHEAHGAGTERSKITRLANRFLKRKKAAAANIARNKSF